MSSETLWVTVTHDEDGNAVGFCTYSGDNAMRMRAFRATHPELDGWALVDAFDSAMGFEPLRNTLDAENAKVRPIHPSERDGENAYRRQALEDEHPDWSRDEITREFDRRYPSDQGAWYWRELERLRALGELPPGY